jgi:predicted metalloprotease with PDZ domain
MDHWSKENMEMLRQGGNKKMREYFKQTHADADFENLSIVDLYESEAAQHYRERLRERVRHILSQSSVTLTSVPNELFEYKRKKSVDSSADSCEEKTHEFHSVVFTADKLGMRLSKRQHNAAVVSHLTPGGFAQQSGVRIGDYVWGVGDQISDDYDDLVRTITASRRPLTVFFYREVSVVVETPAVCTSEDNTADVSSVLDANDSEESSVKEEPQHVDKSIVTDEGVENSLDDSISQHLIACDYRVLFAEGPMGMTLSKDFLDRTEVTAVNPAGNAAKSRVEVGDLVVGVEDHWFMDYDEAVGSLQRLRFPSTVVFRRVARRHNIHKLTM